MCQLHGGTTDDLRPARHGHGSLRSTDATPVVTLVTVVTRGQPKKESLSFLCLHEELSHPQYLICI